jgi:hypothetical protein
MLNSRSCSGVAFSKKVLVENCITVANKYSLAINF